MLTTLRSAKNLSAWRRRRRSPVAYNASRFGGAHFFLAAVWIEQEKIKMPITLPKEETRPDFYSLREFAALFGRERRWAKRLVQQGKVEAIMMAGTSNQLWIGSDQIEAVTRITPQDHAPNL